MGFLDDALAYLLVGVLSSFTTIITIVLNNKYSKKAKPAHSAQSGYSEWVAYLEREITNVKEENKTLRRRVDSLEDRVRDKNTLIERMRAKLLDLSRKYNEDVSNVI